MNTDLKELGDLKNALNRLCDHPLGQLIPEVRSNFGYALHNATEPSEVCAVPGRITNNGDEVLFCRPPRFGASRHIAKVILTAMSFDRELRSAINIKYSGAILDACEKAGLISASFDRNDEPDEIREIEGSTLEWGTQQALKGLTKAPDLVFDTGGLCKEPMIRILGTDPDQVVDKVFAIFSQL